MIHALQKDISATHLQLGNSQQHKNANTGKMYTKSERKVKQKGIGNK